MRCFHRSTVRTRAQIEPAVPVRNYCNLSNTKTKVLSWGNSSSGQLGNSSKKSSPKALEPRWPQPTNIRLISCGESFTLAASKRALYKWGELAYKHEELQPINIPFKIEDSTCHIVQLASGQSHSLILLSNGEVWSFGAGHKEGQLGHGQPAPLSAPQLLQGLKGSSPIVSVACGWLHSLAVDAEGNAYAWGHSHFGQTGHPECTNFWNPILIDKLLKHGKKIKKAAAGVFHSLFLTDDNEVVGFGKNDSGQLGVKFYQEETGRYYIVNHDIKKEKIVDITCGLKHTLMLTESGKVYSCGRANNGQLGLGEEPDRPHPQLSHVPHLPHPSNSNPEHQHPIKGITSGPMHNFAWTDTTLWAWGMGTDFQLGNETRSNEVFAFAVKQLNGFDFVDVKAGWGHSVALVQDKQNKQNL